MSYPNAFCVKCGQHTDTLKKHTVLLQNNARALKGVCPACASQVYKILPKGADFGVKTRLTEEEARKYPDAFCVKCGEHTPTNNQHTVMLENKSRAVTGACGKCGSDVYRIISPRDQGEPAAAKAETVRAEGAKVIQHPASMAPRALQAARRQTRMTDRRNQDAVSRGRWSFLIATGIIACIVIGFFAYSLFI